MPVLCVLFFLHRESVRERERERVKEIGNRKGWKTSEKREEKSSQKGSESRAENMIGTSRSAMMREKLALRGSSEAKKNCRVLSSRFTSEVCDILNVKIIRETVVDRKRRFDAVQIQKKKKLINLL